MQTKIGADILVRHPDSVQVRSSIGESGKLRRATRTAAGKLPAESALLLAALTAAGLKRVETIEITPPSKGPARRAVRGEPIEIEVPVAAGEAAVLLVESGGVYAWNYPESKVAARPSRRSGASVAHFRLKSSTAALGSSAPQRRGWATDWLIDRLVEPVRAFVLRYAARKAVDLAIDWIEGDLVQGPVGITSFDPTSWRADRPTSILLPTGRAARLLLLVHGTFSTTEGSFGALTRHPAGRSLLAVAGGRYDAILGFDHPTLAVDPESNARELLSALRKLGVADGTVVDAVAYSRGGLVYRCLVEQPPTDVGPKLVPGRAIFVGCTNGGTQLADPQNWEQTIDLYTNVSMAGTRAVGLIPGAGAVSAISGEVIKTLGRFVQYLASTAIKERRAPGLEAMSPESNFIKGLNTAIASERTYYAVTADFEPSDKSPGFTSALKDFVLDRVTDRLIGPANDLVVDTPAMTAFGIGASPLAGRLDYGITSEVYHTIYFAQERIARQISEWLDLPATPESIVTPAITLPAEILLSKAKRDLVNIPADAPVILQRLDDGKIRYYARTAGSIQLITGSRGDSLGQAMDLREWQSSPLRTSDIASRVVGELALPDDAIVREWAEPVALDDRGEVFLGLDGVAGVRMPSPDHSPGCLSGRLWLA